MLLFTKPDCAKCDHLKERFDLNRYQITELNLTPDNPEALAELAFHSCVELAEKELPILVTNEKEIYSGLVPIRKYLKTIS